MHSYIADLLHILQNKYHESHIILYAVTMTRRMSLELYMVKSRSEHDVIPLRAI